MKQESKTSWSTEDLMKLVDINNHKIVFDGYQYKWMRNIYGKWELQSIQLYDDYDTPAHYLHYWMAKWQEELNERTAQAQRRSLRAFKKKGRDIRRIANIFKLTTSQKAIEIKSIDDRMTYKDIADTLGVSEVTIKRIFKKK